MGCQGQGCGVRGRLFIFSTQQHLCPKHVFLQWEGEPSLRCTLPRLRREGALRGYQMLLSLTFLFDLSLLAWPHCLQSLPAVGPERSCHSRGNGSEPGLPELLSLLPSWRALPCVPSFPLGSALFAFVFFLPSLTQ